MHIQWENPFTAEGKVSGRAIFEGGFKFTTYEARNKFNSTGSANQGAIGEQSGSDRGVIEER